MTGRWLAHWASAVMCLLQAACSSTHYSINPPLAQIDPDRGYRLQRFVAQDPDDSLLLHVSFSGGGLRAAILGLGVLDELHETHIHWAGKDQRLFDQFDIVMGLSGGSMLVGSLAMGGEAGLARFEQALLHGTTPQADFVHGLFTPASLWRLTSPNDGRSDAFERFLDERLFHGVRFGDLDVKPRKPFAVIYAADMVSGGRFEFVQEPFDFLCSDLDGVTLARAVAASSAVPLLLSPVTFWNHADAASGKGCGSPLLRQATQSQQGHPSSRRFVELDRYRDLQAGQPRRPFIHLVDGGLADNVSARGPTDYIGQFGGHRQQRAIRELPTASPRRLHRCQCGNQRSLARRPKPPGAEATVQAWREDVRQAQASGEDTPFAEDIEFHLIEVSLDSHDTALNERLKAIPTTIELPEADVMLLREHARQRLRSSPEFRAMLRSLQPTAP